MVIRDDLAALLHAALEDAQARGDLPAVSVGEIPVERPQRPEHGDYASSVALKLARAARGRPLEIAARIAARLPSSPLVERVEVAPPGFVNFWLSPAWLREQVAEITRLGPRFGAVDLGRGVRVQVEFVSANPTGPIHVGGGRGAAPGDCLAGVLAACGYDVQREYYVNDAGSRMEAFYQSVYARYLEALGRAATLPPDGYYGAYVADLARELAAEVGPGYLDLPAEQATRELGDRAIRQMIAEAREDLARLGVRFDRWYSEQSLYERGAVQAAIARLRERGYIAEREGATWFVSSALGEDKDNVLIRSNGVPTYFSSDIAYHWDKLAERGFDWVIDLWGADHQGHVPRMKAAINALDLDPQRLHILIYQLVTLKRGGEVVRVSKRAGDIITLREVLDEVGADACRFFFLARAADSPMDFDLELAKQQSSENPVYYVQYAHARIASILRYASGEAEEGGEHRPPADLLRGEPDLSLLTAPPEFALIRKMLELPEIVAVVARDLAPHHLPYYAQELAAVFHGFYRDCRVVSDDVPLSRARLALVQAAKTALANALGLMGVSAPERM
ncbi:MAG: arginine--tRNA ligase [Chloroflexi bacterium]|nr:arginine--tRNA ligase [Chloroflexota bacterium]